MNKIHAPAATYEAYAPRAFAEHLHGLLGGTTWREPMLGATPAAGRLPTAHQLAGAFGMARHKLPSGAPDPHDIGMLVTEDLLFGQTRHAGPVCRAVADAMAADRNSRACRRNRHWLRVVCWAAYHELAHGIALPQLRPGEVTADDWDLLTEAARRIIGALAEEGVHRVRGAMR